MKLKFLFVLFCYTTLSASQSLSERLDTDYTAPFEKLFGIKKICSLLEFGLSEATSVFLENCDHVTSVQMATERNWPDVMASYRYWSEHFSGQPHFIPYFFLCSSNFREAEFFAETTGLNPVFKDAAYLFEIKKLCDILFQERVYDAVLVNPAILIRADLVNELFGRIDIIAAHDTNFHPTIYGWDWLNTPVEYEKIVFRNGSGTIFWIRKTQRELIERMRCLES